jgi:hypothetical protein
VVREHFTQADKSSHNGDVYLDRPRTIEHTPESIATPCSVKA